MAKAKVKTETSMDALNAAIATYGDLSIKATEGTDKRNAATRAYHLAAVDVFADFPDYSPFTLACAIVQASDTADNVTEIPASEDDMRGVKKWNSLGTRRDQMAAIKGATRKMGRETVKACWPEKEDGKRAVTRETFYAACRELRDNIDVKDKPNDLAPLLEKVDKSRSNESKEKRLKGARETLKKAGENVASVATGVAIDTMSEAQLRDAVAALAARATKLRSPLALALTQVAMTPDAAPVAPANDAGETPKTVN